MESLTTRDTESRFQQNTLPPNRESERSPSKEGQSGDTQSRGPGTRITGQRHYYGGAPVNSQKCGEGVSELRLCNGTECT